MKKLLIVLSVIVFTFLINARPVLAGPAMDQYNMTGEESISIKDEHVARQSFRPAVSTITEVKINLSNPSGVLYFVISKYNGEDFDTVVILNDQMAVSGWNTFDIPDTAVTVGGRYRLDLGASESSTRWLYGVKAEDPDLYSRGYATWGLTPELAPINHLDADFQFQIWGTTPVEMVEEEINPGSDQTPEQTGESASSSTAPATIINTSTGAAPSASVSNSLTPPGELTAEYTQAASLTWKASATTDIQGYIIFRSENAGDGYAEIGRTEKTVLAFTDTTEEPGKNYFYMVRAFKGNDQSANSNEARLSVPTDMASNVSTTDIGFAASSAAVKSSGVEMTPLLWGLSGALILFGAFFIFLFIRARKMSPITKIS